VYEPFGTEPKNNPCLCDIALYAVIYKEYNINYYAIPSHML
jgi:hypothetical protein